jgi:hypothetical protein
MSKKQDKAVSLHPLTFEDALKRMLSTPPVKAAKRQKLRKPRKKSGATPSII